MRGCHLSGPCGFPFWILRLVLYLMHFALAVIAMLYRMEYLVLADKENCVLATRLDCAYFNWFQELLKIIPTCLWIHVRGSLG